MKGHVKQLATLALGALVTAGLVAARSAATGAAATAAARTASPTHQDGPLPGFRRVVFLSHVNDPATVPLFPGDPEFTLTPVFTIPKDGFYLNLIHEGEHTGTHFSAPCHFNEGQRCADELAARDYFRPAVVIDVRRQAAADADFEVSVADIGRFERRHGRIPSGAAVIARTGWAERWGTPAYYNFDAAGNVHQPGFSLAAARWLIANRHLGAIGTDTFGPEAATDTEFRVSALVLHGHRLVLENLDGLGRMPAVGGWVVVGGPRNKAGSGAPSTIFGLIP